jgi:hypothetical protein
LCSSSWSVSRGCGARRSGDASNTTHSWATCGVGHHFDDLLLTDEGCHRHDPVKERQLEARRGASRREVERAIGVNRWTHW